MSNTYLNAGKKPCYHNNSKRQTAIYRNKQIESMKGDIIMANLTVNYTGTGKKGLWVRFKNYLAENSQMVFAAVTAMNDNPGYAYTILGDK